MPTKRILVLSPLPAGLVNALLQQSACGADIGDVEIESYQGGTREELLAAVARADIIIGDYTFRLGLDAGTLRAAERCKLVQQPAVGYQHIDVEAAAEAGIPVANAAGANAVAVAEHTIMGALACLKKLPLQMEKMRQGVWAQDEMAQHGVFELLGKNLGILGLGRIGVEVAARARCFGCRVLYWDVARRPEELERELGVEFAPLEELVGQSDVLCLHVPLTPETRGMIDARMVSLMKPGAILVNAARGEVIDEDAVAAALMDGRLGGAVIDVYSEEPVPPDNPLLRAPNTITTPHTAGASNESRMRIIGLAMANVVRVLEGKPPENVVNGVC